MYVGIFIKNYRFFSLSREYAFLLIHFILNNQVNFHTSLAVQSINTRNKCHLYRTIANFHVFRKLYPMTAPKYSTAFHAD